ncbi:hypothetical protein [Paraglaciecola sp.]|uniref:hypothetical protein n=1 Tax=Paraglaciecola sp. TaxID=1920173 RepID=UPI003EF9E588
MKIIEMTLSKKLFFIVVNLVIFSTLSFRASAIPTVPSTVNALIINGDDIRISWSAVSGAKRYERQYNLNNSGWNSNLQTHYNTVVTFTNQPARTTQYRIRACDSSSCSGWKESNSVTIPSLPYAPSNVTASIINGDDIRISWSAVSGSDRYERQYKINNGNWNSNLQIHYNTSVTFANQPPRTTKYRIRVCDSRGCSSWKESNTVTVFPIPTLTAPSTNTDGSYTVSWSDENDFGDIARYELYENNVAKYSGTGRSLQRTGKTVGNYTYKIRVCRTGLGCGYYSDTKTVTVEAPTLPNKVTGVLGPSDAVVNSTFTVSWNNMPDADDYTVLVKSGEAGEEVYQTISGVEGTSTTVSYDKDEVIIIRVQGCNDAGCGPESGARIIEVFDDNVLEPEEISFAWQTSSAIVGEKSTFTWNISNVENCTGILGEGTEAQTFEPSGNSTEVIFYSIGVKTTQWYCTDLANNRYPTDASLFIEAPINITPLAAPQNLKEQLSE